MLFYVKISIFVASCTETHGGHIGESVFALSFPRNLTVSTNVRTTTAPSPVLVVYSSQTIQVWGLFQSVYVRALSEPLGRQTDRLHTFFLHKPADTGVSLHIKLITMKKLLLLLLLPAMLVSCRQNNELGERIEKMKETAEFGTVEYTIKKIIKANDVRLLAIGDRKILFSCTAYLKAGIDLNNFSIDSVTINNNSVTVSLPHAKLLSLNMPSEEIELVYDHVSFFRNGFSSEDRLNLLAQGEADIRNDVVNLGIIEDAEKNAKELFTAMLAQMGFETINIEFN